MGPDIRQGNARKAAFGAAMAAVVAVIVVEIVARLLAAPEPAPTSELTRVPGAAGRDAHRHTTSPEDSPLVVADETLLWRGRPGLAISLPTIPATSTTDGSWGLRLDARGFRATEATKPQPAYRILFVGDSVTLGFNVDQGDEYPAALARLVAERYPGLEIEVINAAVADWSWVQGTAFVLQDGLALAPDLVVAAHGSADQSRATITDSERLWLNEQLSSPPKERSIFDLSVAWKLLRAAWESNPTHQRSRSPSPGCRLQEATGNHCRRVSLPEIGATVRRLGDTTKAAGVDLVLLNADFSGSSSAEAVRQAAIRESFRFVDFAGNVRRQALKDSMVLSRDRGLAFPRLPMVPFGRIGPPPPEGRGPRLRFRAMPEGPASNLRVRGSAPEETGFRFDVPLLDGGTDGDEKAGDGVYSAFVDTTPTVQSLEYQYYTGERAEFETPVSVKVSNADRIVRFNRDGDLPIERYGERELMSDELHPDVEGHRLIAGAIFEEIEKVSSFRRAARAARAVPEASAP